MGSYYSLLISIIQRAKRHDDAQNRYHVTVTQLRGRTSSLKVIMNVEVGV